MTQLNPQFNIKRVLPKDWHRVKKQVMRIEKSAFPVELRQDKDDIASTFLDERDICLIATVGKKIVGCLYSAPVEDFDNYDVPGIEDDPNYGEENSVYLESFAVLKKYRGRGIGKALVKKMTEIAKKDSYKFIVGHYNNTSLRVLTKLGAEVVEEIEGWQGSGKTYSYARLELKD